MHSLGNIERAIHDQETALKYLNTLTTETESGKDDIVWYQSNLAYFYADGNRLDKRRDAIKFAKEGLQLGKDLNILDHVDNYLHVLRIFANTTEDKMEWLKTYEEYKDKIFKKRIRTEDEQKEYEEHYNNLKKELNL